MKEGSICNKCNHRAYCDMSDEHNNDNATIKGCYLYSEQKVKTNADRIRSMSDEELAEYLFERGNADEYCYGICIHQDDIYACVNAMKQSKCIQGVIAWLKQESTDDHQSM